MPKPDFSDLDMIGRELYTRRMFELTLFGAMSDADAHDSAMRFAMGSSVIPSPDNAYPDDYTAGPRGASE